MPATFSWPTIVTLIVSSVIVPWLASHGLTLTPEQAAWLSTTAVAVMTSIAHWLHAHVAAQNPLKSKP